MVTQHVAMVTQLFGAVFQYFFACFLLSGLGFLNTPTSRSRKTPKRQRGLECIRRWRENKEGKLVEIWRLWSFSKITITQSLAQKHYFLWFYSVFSHSYAANSCLLGPSQGQNFHGLLCFKGPHRCLGRHICCGPQETTSRPRWH